MAFRSDTIDRSSPVPVYHQIEQDLKRRIIRHEWGLNDRLPSENELCQYYQVSRLTLRQALKSLEQQNIIRRQRGSGTFICENLSAYVTNLNYEMISRDRMTDPVNKITAEVLEKRLTSEAPLDVLHRLQLEVGASLVFIKRVYYRNTVPLAVGRSFVSAALVPGIEAAELINNSVAQTLEERFNLHPQRIDDYIEGFHSNQEDCALLRCASDTPLILVESTAYLANGTPLDTTQTVWVGDMARFHVQLVRGRDGYELNNNFSKMAKSK